MNTAGSHEWDEIHAFHSPGQFQRFLAWIAEAVDEGWLTEVPVRHRYSGASVFDERWFRSLSGEHWRLVAPDPPFTGVFLKVDRE